MNATCQSSRHKLSVPDPRFVYKKKLSSYPLVQKSLKAISNKILNDVKSPKFKIQIG
jgi:hypothetical protein